MICDTQGVVNIVSKFLIPSSYSLGVKVFLKIFKQKDDRQTDLMNYDGVKNSPGYTGSVKYFGKRGRT